MICVQRRKYLTVFLNLDSFAVVILLFWPIQPVVFFLLFFTEFSNMSLPKWENLKSLFCFASASARNVQARWAVF